MTPISKIDINKSYRRYAPYYDLLFGAVLEQGRRKLVDAVRQQRPASILEIGIGTGLTLHRYPESSYVVGIDISEEMLEHARRRAKAMPDRKIDLKVMDAEALSFADGSFDCIAVPYVLSVTPDPRRLVAELRRVCSKNGTIVIANHFSGERFWKPLERATRMVADTIGFRSEFSFEEHIAAHDWQIESVTSANLLSLSKVVVIRNA